MRISRNLREIISLIKKSPDYKKDPATMMAFIVKAFPESFLKALTRHNKSDNKMSRKRRIKKRRNKLNFFTAVLSLSGEKGPRLESILKTLPDGINLAIFIYIIYKKMNLFSKYIFDSHLDIYIFCSCFFTSKTDQHDFTIFLDLQSISEN